VLDNAKKIQESRWEMPKGFWIAARHFLTAIGKPLGNAQIKLTPLGQMFLLAGCDEKSRK
jgi:hypothetical protein